MKSKHVFNEGITQNELMNGWMNKWMHLNEINKKIHWINSKRNDKIWWRCKQHIEWMY